MRTKTNIFTAIVMAVVGIALIVLHDRVDLLAWTAVLIGIMFMIPSVFALVMTFYNRRYRSDRGVNVSTVIASLAGIALGLAMCITPSTFAAILVYVFAAILVISGIYHVLFISWLARPLTIPGFCYIIPALLIVTGFVIIFTSIRTLNTVVVLVTGIALLLSAVNTAIETVTARRTDREPARQ